MNEIDLIPASYRRQLQFKRWLKQTGLLLIMASLLMVGAFVGLRTETQRITAQMQQLQSQKAISTQQRNELEQLTSRRQELTRQLNLLAGLRSGSAAEQMFLNVDRAMLSEGLWFTDWRFQRAGSVAEKAPKTVNSGYFILVPADGKGAAEAWKIETHMTIQGQALDHAALSEFVSKLIEQPGIESVRVVKTELTSLYDLKLVNFSLDILVAGGEGKS
jgi:cell division protein FtsB